MPNPPWTHNTLGLIALTGTCLGQQFVNVWHFEASALTETALVSDTVAQEELADFATAWLAATKAAYLEMHPSDYTLVLMRAQVLERKTQWRHRLTPIETNITSGNTGSITAGTAEDTTTSGVVRWRTPQAGKRYRGRTYIGPVSQGYQADGRLQSGAITIYQAWIDAMDSYWVTAGIPPAWNQTVYSRPYNIGEYQYTVRDSSGLHVVTPPEYAGNSTNVNAAVVDPILRSQRRREIGVGV